MDRKERIAQEIEQLRRKYKNKKQSAKAIFDKGYGAGKEGNIDDAIAYYSAIGKNDSQKYHAMAQVNLGNLYRRQNKDDLAEATWKNIRREDRPESYAKSQVNLGNLYRRQNKDDLAEATWKNIRREDRPESYARSQFNLGNLYDEQGKLDLAEATWKNIRREDRPESYAKSQVNLGNLYRKQNKDDLAEATWKNIRREDHPESYAKSQLNLIILYITSLAGYYVDLRPRILPNITFSSFNPSKVLLAERAWKNFNILDNPVGYVRIGMKLALCYGRIGSEEKARNIWQVLTNKENQPYFKVVEYSFETAQDYLYIQIISIIAGNADLKAKYFQKIENLDDLYGKLGELSKNIDNILEAALLKFESNGGNEQFVAHYTSPAVLFALLKNDSAFRLNVIDHMNDPREGKILNKCFSLEMEKSDIKSFVSSFSFNHNHLNQFRLYGNEDKAGSGVSLVLDKAFFSQDIELVMGYIPDSQNIRPTAEDILFSSEMEDEFNENRGLSKLPLFRCVYFDPDTQYMRLAQRSEASFYQQCEPYEADNKFDNSNGKKHYECYIGGLGEKEKIKKIRDYLDQIGQIIGSLKEYSSDIDDLAELINIALLPISCLFKHAAFEEENECRMIYTTHLSDYRVTRAGSYSETSPFYIQYPEKVSVHLNKIYLGPQFKQRNRDWIEDYIDNNRPKIKVKQSDLPLRDKY